jgi:hypothetical protein
MAPLSDRLIQIRDSFLKADFLIQRVLLIADNLKLPLPDYLSGKDGSSVHELKLCLNSIDEYKMCL